MTGLTDQQLDDLERLLRERDEARDSLNIFLDRYRSAGPSITIGQTGVECRRLCEAHRAADWRLQTAATAVAPALLAEVRRLRGVIAQHDLCHDLHGQVNAGDFARGCAAEQRRLYGCSPDADRATTLERKLADVLHALGRHTGPCDAELMCEGCLNVKDTIAKALEAKP
jgi:hypothetical protein